MRGRLLSLMAAVAALGLWTQPAVAQYFDSGSTGADGAWNPSCTPTPCTVIVTLPANGVFNYTTVSVPTGVTVKYLRNAANTPVRILATGSVTITGTIDVSGTDGTAGALATQFAPNRGLGGPGGFDGGNGSNGLLVNKGGDGLGPGGAIGGDFTSGAPRGGGGGSYLTAGGTANSGGAGGAVYGTPTLAPLIGGSGGGGAAGVFPTSTGTGGGGGGGALLIAAGTSSTPATITVNGALKSRGGVGGTGGTSGFSPVPAWGGAGSGGSIRLVAQTIGGTGSLDVAGGIAGFSSPAGGFGRVRIEAASYAGAFAFATGTPAAAVSPVTQPLPATLPNNPTLTVTSVAGVTAPATLTGSFATPDFVLPAGTSTPTVNFAAANIPLGTTLAVTVKGQAGGVISTTTSTGLSGTIGSSTASATVTIPTTQPSVITATASFTLLADAGGGPVYADGEPVERVRITAAFGGPSEVIYITASGREFVVASAR